MNKSIPTLYLNENIPVRLVKLLLNIGILAVHTINVSNQGVDDEFQLQYAADRKYILISHNRKDFKHLHKEWIRKGKSHSGILVMRHGEPEYLAVRIERFFEEVYPSITPPFCTSPPPVNTI